MREEDAINLEASASANLGASASAFLIPSPLSELQDKKKELLESLGDFDHIGDFLVEKKDEITVFFLIGKEKLEDLGIKLATQEIIQDLEDENINKSALFEEKDADKIYELLRCYNVISKEELKKAEKVFNIRGSIAHQPKSRYTDEKFRDSSKLQQEIEDTMEILESIKSKVN